MGKQIGDQVEKLFFVHYRTRNHGTVTFCIEVPAAPEPGVPPVAGWAFCAPRDEFTRSRGRLIARGRGCRFS